MVPAGRTLLFFAAALGASEVLAELLSPNLVDPNARCHAGLTALHFAAAHGQLGSVRQLLGAGAQVARVRSNCYESRPLLRAVRSPAHLTLICS